MKELQDELDRVRLDMAMREAEYYEWQQKLKKEEKYKKLMNTLKRL